MKTSREIWDTVLVRNQELFCWSSKTICSTSVVQHKIDAGGSRPIKQLLHHSAKRGEALQVIEEMYHKYSWVTIFFQERFYSLKNIVASIFPTAYWLEHSQDMKGSIPFAAWGRFRTTSPTQPPGFWINRRLHILWHPANLVSKHFFSRRSYNFFFFLNKV